MEEENLQFCKDQHEVALQTGAQHHRIPSSYSVPLLSEPICDRFRETRDKEIDIVLILRNYAGGLGRDWRRRNHASNGLSSPNYERYLDLYTGSKNVEHQKSEQCVEIKEAKEIHSKN